MSQIIAFPRTPQAVEPDWYSISTLPPYERVILRHGGWGEATGWKAFSRRGQPIYYRIRPDTSVEQLRSFATPELWRPQVPARWAGPLPEPAVVTREPDPPLPPTSKRRKVVRLALAGELPLPWAIAYSAAGDISLEECEARLLRALKTDRALPDRERQQLRVKIHQLDTEPAPGDWPMGITLRWAPFREDIHDYVTAMGWFAALSQRERRLVRERVMGWSFTRMGDERGRSDEWARQQYIEALIKAWIVANVKP